MSRDVQILWNGVPAWVGAVCLPPDWSIVILIQVLVTSGGTRTLWLTGCDPDPGFIYVWGRITLFWLVSCNPDLGLIYVRSAHHAVWEIHEYAENNGLPISWFVIKILKTVFRQFFNTNIVKYVFIPT